MIDTLEANRERKSGLSVQIQISNPLQNKDRYNHFLKYFHNELYNKVPRFISRFKGLNFHNQKILDLGCGLGALSVFLSKHGTMEIIGLDINKNKLKFAKNNLSLNFPELNNIHFVSVPLNDLEDLSLNMIISKASFEHILHLKDLLVLILLGRASLKAKPSLALKSVLISVLRSKSVQPASPVYVHAYVISGM